MREIKFRAWDISKRKILRNVGFHPHICMIHEGYKTGDDAELTIAPDFTNYKIMQYTGLKDKNGVEIYEGDIIKANESGVSKEWAYKELVAFDDKWHGFAPMCLPRMVGRRIVIEVIGNIHQNPELLHGAAK